MVPRRRLTPRAVSPNDQLAVTSLTGRARQVDLDLIVLLLQFICREGNFRDAPLEGEVAPPQGAVLVFLPGWDEIMRLKESLEGPSTLPASRHPPFTSTTPPFCFERRLSH